MTDEQEDDWSIDTSLQDLYSILSLKRPHESRGELELIKRFLIPAGLNRDDFGNWFIRIGEAPVLWSCHIDTVHTIENEKDVVQKLLIDKYGILSAEKSSCLGADCGAGIWLMLRMLKAGVEGLYIFHRDEESGGHGSKWIAESNPSFLDGIKFAIAFDRRGTGSIITHQWMGRCCSDAFVKSLSDAIGLDHEGDSGGTFTDTANYTTLIPECTNLSVGYYNEHSFKENLDTNYLKRLLDALLGINLQNLVVERKVTDKDDYDYNKWWTNQGLSNFDEYFDETWGDISERTIRMIRRHPYQIATILRDWGVLDDIMRELNDGS